LTGNDEAHEDNNSSLSSSNEYIIFSMKVEKGIITELTYQLKD